MRLCGACCWCLKDTACSDDPFDIFRRLLHLQSVMCLWSNQSEGQFLQERLSFVFLTFSKVRHIFSQNNKCVQGNTINRSIKDPHRTTICFSCSGIKAAHLIIAVYSAFFLVVKYIYFFFHSICISLFRECMVDINTTLLFFFGTMD